MRSHLLDTAVPLPAALVHVRPTICRVRRRPSNWISSGECKTISIGITWFGGRIFYSFRIIRAKVLATTFFSVAFVRQNRNEQAVFTITSSMHNMSRWFSFVRWGYVSLCCSVALSFMRSIHNNMAPPNPVGIEKLNIFPLLEHGWPCKNRQMTADGHFEDTTK